MPHPQNSPRGLWAKDRIAIKASGGLYLNDYSATSLLLSANSTGLVLAGAVKVSNKTAAVLSGNSTGVIHSGGASFSGKTGAYITQNSTGILIGSRYISTNTTGNSTT